MSTFTKILILILIGSALIGFSIGWNCASEAKVREASSQLPPSSDTLLYVSPVPSERVLILSTTFYATSKTQGRQHWDIVVEPGTELVSPTDGVIEKFGWDISGTGGNYIVILADDGNRISLCHLRDDCPFYKLSKGQRVKAGQLIGYTGDTGYGTGAHLHLMITKYGLPVNPLKLFGGNIKYTLWRR